MSYIARVESALNDAYGIGDAAYRIGMSLPWRTGMWLVNALVWERRVWEDPTVFGVSTAGKIDEVRAAAARERAERRVVELETLHQWAQDYAIRSRAPEGKDLMELAESGKAAFTAKDLMSPEDILKENAMLRGIPVQEYIKDWGKRAAQLADEANERAKLNANWAKSQREYIIRKVDRAAAPGPIDEGWDVDIRTATKLLSQEGKKKMGGRLVLADKGIVGKLEELAQDSETDANMCVLRRKRVALIAVANEAEELATELFDLATQWRREDEGASEFNKGADWHSCESNELNGSGSDDDDDE